MVEIFIQEKDLKVLYVLLKKRNKSAVRAVKDWEHEYGYALGIKMANDVKELKKNEYLRDELDGTVEQWNDDGTARAMGAYSTKRF
jgi:hypothetical protein